MYYEILSLQQPYEVLAHFQMRNLRLGETKEIDKGHKADIWGSQDLRPQEI